MSKFKKEPVLIFLLVIAFWVRLYKIDGPVADWHSWRQADTAAVARNFLKFGFDPLRPRYDDLSNVQSGLDNPQGYRMVEFPIYQILGTGLYQLIKFMPGFTIEISLRLISIISSLGIMVVLYELTKKKLGKWGSLGSVAVFAFLPYSIFYSRAILPEMLAVCLAMVAIWVFEKFKNIKGQLGSGILASLAILTTPTAGFLLLPLVYLWLKDFKLKWQYFLSLLVFLLVSFGPFFLWRRWILQFPEGIPANIWLLNGDGIRFTKAFFRWLLFERLTKLILGYWLILPFLAGTVFIFSKKHVTYLLLMLGVVFYAFIFATGSVRHDYYQIIWLPAVAIFTGSLLQYNKFKWKVITLFCFLLAVLASWRTISSYYWINNYSMIEAGRMVDKITPQNAKIIAPYGGDTAFLYQTNRQGWPVGFEIEKKIALGADYYVNTNVNDGETKYVQIKWQTIVANDKYVIVKLR